jgi:putative inorganic carbon (hco3(-)) transporter
LNNRFTLGNIIFLSTLSWYIALSPFLDTFSSISSLYDEKRGHQLLLISISLLLIIFSSATRGVITNFFCAAKKTTLAYLLLMISLGVLSSFYAPLPIYAFTEFFTFLGLAILALLLASTTVTSPNLSLIVIISSSCIFALIYEIEFLTSYIAALIVDKHINLNLLFPYFSNIRFFNQYQIWLIPLTLSPLVIFKISHKLTQYSLFLLSGLWITVLLTSQSRGAQISILLALCVTLLVYRKSALQLFKTSLIVTIIGSSIFFLLFKIIPSLLLFITNNKFISISLTRFTKAQESSNIRIALWEKAVDFIQSHPFLGIGPMHYAYYPGQHNHPHNSALQIASEFGLPFFILSVLLLISFILYWIKISKKEVNCLNISFSSITIFGAEVVNNQKIWAIFFFSLTSGLIYSMVSGVFVMPMSQSIMAIIFGVMIGLANNNSQTQREKSIFHSISFQIVTGALAIGLLLAVLPHMTTRVLNPFFATYRPTQTAGPRYWELGGLIQQPASNTPFSYEHSALTPPRTPDQ